MEVLLLSKHKPKISKRLYLLPSYLWLLLIRLEGLKRLAQQLKRCGLCSAMTRAQFKAELTARQVFFGTLNKKRGNKKPLG